MSMTEDGLCAAFAERVKESPEFSAWVLQRTKFRKYSDARLLHVEQINIRPRKAWWRHWWCHIPELEKDRETDIFLAFEVHNTKKRFALHVENKKGNGRFSEGQAEAYKVRAMHMAGKPEYLNYAEFATVLIAPLSFKEKHASSCEHFDSYISYEEIAPFISEFRLHS